MKCFQACVRRSNGFLQNYVTSAALNYACRIKSEAEGNSPTHFPVVLIYP